MVKLLGIAIFYKDGTVTPLKSASDLQSFNFFYRKNIGEFLTFATKVAVERTQPGQRQSVKQEEQVCHVYVRGDGLAGVITSDKEYPSRVAFTVLSKVLEDFGSKVPKEKWQNSSMTTIDYDELEGVLQKYQDPKEADAMSRVQSELDDTKIILHETMESLMQRGEKIDDLVAKSDQLSDQSKMFYKQAKKMNSWCCTIQ